MHQHPYSLRALFINLTQEWVARRNFRGLARLVWISRYLLVGPEPRPIWYRRRFRFICEPDSWYSVMTAFGFIHTGMEGLLRDLIHSFSRDVAFIDAGANVGFVSLLAGSMTRNGHNVSVHSFEPNPFAFNQLNANLALNDLQIEANQIALGALPGRVSMILGSASSNSTLVAGGLTYVPTIGQTEVEVTTLDTYCARLNLVPDIIKVDVEGYEPQVIAGAEEILSRVHPFLIVEINPRTLAAAQASAAQLLERLRALGYSVFRVTREFVNVAEDKPCPVRNWHNCEEITSSDMDQSRIFDVLAVPTAYGE